MPRESFRHPDNAENPKPDLTIRWAPAVLFIQGDILITKDNLPDLDRAIRSLKRARSALRAYAEHEADLRAYAEHEADLRASREANPLAN